MKTIDIAFVVLHYLTYKDTYECVNSIIDRIDTSNYIIIIVDNASNNNSIEDLMNVFGDKSSVVFVLNNKNLGFANGLNKGIDVAKKYNPNFIATINNDTVLLSNHFYEVLSKKYEQYSFHVLGPMILTKDGLTTSNPVRKDLRTKKEAIGIMKRNNLIIFLAKAHLLWLIKIKRKLSSLFLKTVSREPVIDDQEDVQLHGAFWVFSRDFFSFFAGLDNRTFLYGEESLLFLHLKKRKMKSLYTPDIIIFHKEDCATNEAIKNFNRNTIFKCKEGNKSMKVYCSVFDEYEKELDNGN